MGGEAAQRQMGAEGMRQIRAEDLRQILGGYDLGDLWDFRRAPSGHVNDNWIVQTSEGCFFLKHRHPSLCCPSIIRAQHALMNWLRQAGFPAPELLPSREGETLLLLDGACYEVQEYIPGQPYDHGRPAHLDEAARVLGRYHALVQDFSRLGLNHADDLYSPAFVHAHLECIGVSWESAGRPAPDHLMQRLRAHAADLSTRWTQRSALPCLVIHGDYYAQNLLFRGDRIIGVVDYDKACWQPRLAELAEALIYFASPRRAVGRRLSYPGVLESDLFSRFARGYGRAVTLTEDEALALPDYVRCIWLQMSLQHPLDGLLQAGEDKALRELLVLADWARAHAAEMTGIGRSLMSAGQAGDGVWVTTCP